MQNFFVKTHGLGNDYIVMDNENISFEMSIENIVKICDVHYGIGSDGILLKMPSEKADFWLTNFKPGWLRSRKKWKRLTDFCQIPV